MVHTDLEVVKGDGAGCGEKVSGSFGGSMQQNICDPEMKKGSILLPFLRS